MLHDKQCIQFCLFVCLFAVGQALLSDVHWLSGRAGSQMKWFASGVAPSIISYNLRYGLYIAALPED